MLPRLYWHGTLTLKITDKYRERLNCEVRSFMIKEQQCHISYPSIKTSELVLFRHDGTHLSPTGLDILRNNIQGELETFVFGTDKFFPAEC